LEGKKSAFYRFYSGFYGGNKAGACTPGAFEQVVDNLTLILQLLEVFFIYLPRNKPVQNYEVYRFVFGFVETTAAN
jgi:hypothetical protein